MVNNHQGNFYTLDQMNIINVTPVYGAKTQYATQDETPPLTAQQCLTIQKVTGSVLYYARAVDPTVLMPLNDIAT
jgi:hypothetical protein